MLWLELIYSKDTNPASLRGNTVRSKWQRVKTR